MIYNGHISNSLVTPVWQAGNVYSTNDLVVYNSLIYRVKTTHTAATAPNADSTNYEVANLNTSNLFVDSVNNRVGINTSSPDSLSKLHIVANSATDREVVLEQRVSSVQGNVLRMRKNRSGGVITDGDSIGTISFSGYDGSNYISSAAIVGVSKGTVVAGSIPTDLVLYTGTTSTVERMRINSAGEVSIGTSNAISSVKLNVTHGFSQTDTTERMVSFFGSNDAASAGVAPSGLVISYKGGASLGVREVGIYNTLYGSASTGILNLNRGALIIDSSGNVGIGTTASSIYKLDISGGFRANSSTTTVAPLSGISFAIGGVAGNFSENIYISNVIGGNVSIMRGRFVRHTTGSDWTGVSYKLQHSVDATDMGYISFNPGNGAQGISFGNGNTEYARINASGILYSLPTYNNTTGVAANMVVGSDGGMYRSTSSIKYKKDVTPYNKGLADVLKLNPVFYKSKQQTDGDQQFAGFIAEEVEEVGLKEFVQYSKDGSPDALSYANMTALMAKAIQELSSKIDVLQNEINVLKAK